MDNSGAVLLAIRNMEMRAIEMPTYGDSDVLIKMEYCGVCGSDVHQYEHGEAAFPDMYPFILGHECAGEVVAVGNSVTHLSPGDKVAVEPGITCGKCEWCKGGKYNLCPHVDFLSAPRYDGAMRKCVAHPAELCFKLPPNISTLDGALIEPLSVGLNAAVQSGIRIGKRLSSLVRMHRPRDIAVAERSWVLMMSRSSISSMFESIRRRNLARLTLSMPQG